MRFGRQVISEWELVAEVMVVGTYDRNKSSPLNRMKEKRHSIASDVFPWVWRYSTECTVRESFERRDAGGGDSNGGG